MWALCRALGLRYGEETGAPRGPLRPASPSSSTGRLCSSPPPAPRGQPGLPNNLSCPHPGHRPTSSAVSGRRGGVLLRKDGRHVAPSSGTEPLVLRPESPHPPRGSREPRASPSDPGVRAWWLSSARSGRRSQTAGPGESRRRRGRGEPGAPPRLPTERRRSEGRPRARGAGSPQRRWDWNTSAARPGRSPCRQARPPPRAHGWASPQGDVAGGACVTLRRRGVRALDGPEERRALPRPRPRPPPRGGPAHLSTEVGRTSCSRRSFCLVPRLFK